MGSGNADNTQETGLAASTEQRALSVWRWFSVAGGAALGLTFFLPAYTTFLRGISPAQRCLGALRGIRYVDYTPNLFPAGWMGDVDATVMYHSATVAACLCPYLAGWLAAVGAVARRRGSVAVQRWHRLFLAVVITATAATLVMWSAHFVTVCLFMPGPFFGRLRPLSWWFWPLAVSALIAYLFRAWRDRRYGHLHTLFAGAVILVIWFGANFQTALAGYFPRGTPGVPLGMFGALLLAVGTLGEFRAVAGVGWPRAVRYLLTAGAPTSGASCRQCGYDLRGLPEMRCPECGRPFTLEEITPNPRPPAPGTTI